MWLEWYVCNYCRCIVGVLFHRGVHEVIFCCLVYIEMVIIMFNIEHNLVALMFWMETKIFYEFLLWISFWLIRCFSLEWILICQQTCFSKETGKIKEKKKKKQGLGTVGFFITFIELDTYLVVYSTDGGWLCRVLSEGGKNCDTNFLYL